MATVFDDVPAPSRAPHGIPLHGTPPHGTPPHGASARGARPRVDDAPPARDRAPRTNLRVSATRVVGVVKTAAPPVGRGVLQIGALLWQLISTAAVLSVTSFVVLLGAGYADGVGALLLCLLFAIVAAGVGTVFGVIVGLPLRLSRRARGWWIRNGELAFVGVALGVLGMVVAFVVGGSSGPVGGLLIPGWLVFAASLANTWWPDRWRPARFRSARPRPTEAESGAAESGATASGAGTRGSRRRGVKASYEEFLAASGRAFRGERSDS